MEQEKPPLDERWQQQVVQAMGKDLTEAEQVELHTMMFSPAFVKAAGLIMLHCDLQRNQLLKLNFGNEEHRAMASQVQGRVTGMQAVFGMLLSNCKEKANEK